VLPLYIEQVGVARADVALVSGILFSIMAGTGALGHHVCGRLMRRFETRLVIAGGVAAAAAGCALLGASGVFSVMCAASAILGLGIGAAMTASYSAAGRVIPAGAHGTGFGVLTSASLVGMASSPFIAGALGGTSIRVVFFVDLAIMAGLALVVQRTMANEANDEAPASFPATNDQRPTTSDDHA
jgi:MFS family permease